jgi:thymidylate synthase (FAD)
LKNKERNTMNVKLISVTPDAEATMAYIARVSNPANQDNPDYAKLLGYCIRHGHWSVFEHSHMTLEITTSLAVAAQILRHRSFTFQQLSRRYNGDLPSFELVHLRRQAEKNRQSSTEFIQDEYLAELIDAHLAHTVWLYDRLLSAGVARECARMVLPQATSTTLYMTGNCRSWIHYLQQRTQPDTQLEHRMVAIAAREIFDVQFPTVAAALEATHAKS